MAKKSSNTQPLLMQYKGEVNHTHSHTLVGHSSTGSTPWAAARPPPWCLGGAAWGPGVGGAGPHAPYCVPQPLPLLPQAGGGTDTRHGPRGRLWKDRGLDAEDPQPWQPTRGEAFLTQGGGHLGCISEDLLGPGGVGACTLTSWHAQGQSARPCPSGLDKETPKEGMVGKSDSDFFRGE